MINKYKRLIRNKYNFAFQQLKKQQYEEKLRRLSRQLNKTLPYGFATSGTTRFKRQLQFQRQQMKPFFDTYEELLSTLDEYYKKTEDITSSIIEDFVSANTTKTIFVREEDGLKNYFKFYDSIKDIDLETLAHPTFIYALNTLMNVRKVEPEKGKILRVKVDGNEFRIKPDFVQMATYQKHFIQGGGRGSLQDWFQLHIGYPGTGKTVMGLVWMLLIDDHPSIDKIAMRTEDIPPIVLTIPKNSVLIIDEGATALNAKEARKKENTKIEVLFSVMRQNKGLFVIINMTDFLLLARNVRGARSRSLIRMKFDLDKLRSLSKSVDGLAAQFGTKIVSSDVLRDLQLKMLEKAYSYRIAEYYSMKKLYQIRKDSDVGRTVFPPPNFSGKVEVIGGPLFAAYSRAATEWKRKVEEQVVEEVKNKK